MSRALGLAAPILLVAALLGAWEAACRLLAVPQYLVPTPSAVGLALAQNAVPLVVSAGRTLAMAMEALAAAAVFAGVLALCVSISRTLDRAIRPLARPFPPAKSRTFISPFSPLTNPGFPSILRWRRYYKEINNLIIKVGPPLLASPTGPQFSLPKFRSRPEPIYFRP